MLDVLPDRTPAIIAAWPRATQHCPEACRKRRSTAEPCPPWLIGSSVINILPLKAQVKHRVTPSPPRHYPVKFEITFCVRGVKLREWGKHGTRPAGFNLGQRIAVGPDGDP